MVTTTPKLGLTLPTVGANRDTWGTLLNEDLTILDQAAIPIGVVLDFAGATAPPGYLICDGRTVSRTTYSDLFAAIGTAWGSGDGSTTFRLPNTPGRASVGPGTVTDSAGNAVAYTFGQSTGAVRQSIQQTHLPNYNLTVSTAGAHTHLTNNQGDHTHTVYGGTFNAPGPQLIAAGTVPTGADATTSAAGSHNHTTDSQGSHTHVVSLAGGAQPLSVVSPVIVMNKIIYAGAQATTRAASAQRRETTPLRGDH